MPHPHRPRNHERRQHSERFNQYKVQVPKLAFPIFDSKNPRIWKDKCENYFEILNTPDFMKLVITSMHMDGNSTRWLQVYKLKNGLGSWEQFIKVVEEKFGANEYRTALGELMELKQTASVEEYISAFEMQYQLTMLNTGLGDMFFLRTFVKGLVPKLRTTLQSLVPKTLERALLVAKI